MCIAGVADQLQTNFASDLRQILRSVFLMNTTPPQEEIIQPKPKDTDFFEFRASENDVIQENAGSNQSIYSAEEVNAESPPGTVFVEVIRQERSASLETESRLTTNDTTAVVTCTAAPRNVERSRSLGGDDDSDTQIDDNRRHSFGRDLTGTRSHPHLQHANDADANSNSSSSSTTSNGSPILLQRRTANSSMHDNAVQQQQRQHNCPNAGNRLMAIPPAWIPDEEAPRCMACALSFTTFRRRHHCRNCGGVFCGVCSNSSAPLPKFGLIKAVRVCRDCYMREVGT